MNQPKIYTKTGDKGLTRLVDGRECSKSSLRVESYGTVDELNSSLGLVLMALKKTGSNSVSNLAQEIEVIQNKLFNVGSHLACEKPETRKMLPEFDEGWIGSLEKSIDQMTAQLPPLREFILPGGSEPAAFLHLARTVCRRAERLVVRVLEEKPESKQNSTVAENHPEDHRALRYLNRLSDYLFVAARFANSLLGSPDQVWKKHL
jgi:cob(I)alamin adenosyltransferase